MIDQADPCIPRRYVVDVEVPRRYGTSGAIRMVVPKPQVDEDGALFCYALTDSAWVVGGAVSNGGVVIRLAEGTIKEYLHTIFRKLGVKNRTELALWMAHHQESAA